MPTLAPTPDRFTVLDSLIVRALAELRTARRACGRPGDARALELALELRTQAEANLNALLEYRHAAQRR